MSMSPVPNRRPSDPTPDVGQDPHCPTCGNRDGLIYGGRSPSTDLWTCGKCGREFHSEIPADPAEEPWPSKQPGTAGE
jgi:hypothetical protein